MMPAFPPIQRLDLFAANLSAYAYPRHMHETYVVALGRNAGYAFECRGETHLARPGALIVINPGEVHNGRSADGGIVHYRSAYPSVDLMTRIAEQVGDPREQHRGGPLFCRSVIDDPPLARRFEIAHECMQRAPESADGHALMLEALATLIARHSTKACPLSALAGDDRAAVRRAKTLLDEHFAEAVPLDVLAAAARLSPFHLLREFRRHVGLPPHAYQINTRVEHARRMLADGASISQAACRCGFADQAHLTRAFRRIMGAPPGAYARMSARSFKTAAAPG